MAPDASEFSDLYTGATYCVGKALSTDSNGK
jgi:hypothetical protein